jgi:hypothetical protein
MVNVTNILPRPERGNNRMPPELRSWWRQLARQRPVEVENGADQGEVGERLQVADDTGTTSSLPGNGRIRSDCRRAKPGWAGGGADQGLQRPCRALLCCLLRPRFSLPASAKSS